MEVKRCQNKGMHEKCRWKDNSKRIKIKPLDLSVPNQTSSLARMSCSRLRASFVKFLIPSASFSVAIASSFSAQRKDFSST